MMKFDFSPCLKIPKKKHLNSRFSIHNLRPLPQPNVRLAFFIYLFIYLFNIYLFIYYLFIIYLFIYLFVCLFVFIYLFIYLLICLFVCLYIYDVVIVVLIKLPYSTAQPSFFIVQ